MLMGSYFAPDFVEEKRNRDGSFNLHSVLKHENLNRIQEQLKEFEKL